MSDVYMYDSIISFCKASQKNGGNGSIEMEESNETTSEMSQSDEYIKTVHEFGNVVVFVCKFVISKVPSTLVRLYLGLN